MNKTSKILILSSIFIILGIGFLTALPRQASAQNPSLTGTVTEPDGETAVGYAWVTVRNSNWTFYQGNSADENGEFTFYDVPAGNYTVEVSGSHATYKDPDPIQIYIPGSPVYDMGTISLLEPSIQLTLTKSDGTTPVPYTYVNLHDTNYNIWKYESTNVDGVVTFGVDSNGTYVLEVYDRYEGESPPDPISFTYSGTPVTLEASFVAPNVYGYVLNPDETPCTECSISLYTNNWNYSYWANPDENGYFGLYIDYSATYNFRINYWGTGYSEPDPTTVTINANTNNNLGNRYLATPNITGTLLTPDGDPVTNTSWDFNNNNWTISKWGQTDENGDFGIAIGANGTYKLSFWVNQWNYPDYASPPTQTIVYSGSPIDLGEIRLSPAAMTGKVVTESGSPVANAQVDVHDQSYSWENSYWGQTDVNGEFKVNKSFATGTYYVNVNPPWDQEGLLPSDTVSVQLTAGTTSNYYYTHPIKLATARKKITGTVSYPDGRPVTDASINTWAMGGMFGGYAWDQTNSQGKYTLWVGKGSYGINIWPYWSGDSEPDWGAPSEQYVEFTGNNSTSETEVINFTVLEYDATLTGKIVRPDGTALGSDINANVDAWEKGGKTGNWAQVNSNGNFTMKLAGGHTYDINIWAWDWSGGGKEYAGPAIAPVKMTSDQTYNLGTVQLVEKNAHVTGKVTDTNGNPIENCYIDAWSTSAGGWGWAQSDSSGNYDMLVFGGTYQVHAFPSWDAVAEEEGANYVPITPPTEVTIQANRTVSDVNFQMGIADATIKGHLETADGDLINTWGWVNASNDRDDFQQGDMWYGGFLGAPLESGQFSINVPAGKYELKAFMDWNADYIQDSDVAVTIESGETKDDVIVTMIPTNSKIQGTFKDSDGNKVYGLWGQVFGDRAEGGSTFSQVNPDGTYSLKVAAGTWNLDYWLDPWSGAGYLPSSLESKKVTIDEDETKTLDFTVLKTDSEISGIVEDEDGTPIEGAHVYASLDYAGQQRNNDYMYYGFDSLEAVSDQDGAFTLMIPEGEYYIHASLPPALGYIFTGAQLVYTAPNDPVEDVEVVFESADAQITGTVTDDGENSEAFIYAYTNNGGYSETTTTDGDYTIPVTRNKTWHIGAIKESGTAYYVSEQADVVVDSDSETQNLALEYQGEMPESTSATFDATQAYTLELEDGFSIKAPARAFATEGYVTLTVKPTAKMAYQAGSRPLMGYGYEITVRESDGSTVQSFNSNVTLTMPYSETVLASLGLDESDLSGEYYDTTSGSWEGAASIIVDEDNNLLIIQTDHFSTFSPITPPVDTADALSVTVTLPPDGAVVNVDSVVVAGTVSDADATVTIRLNGVSIGEVTVDSSGAFLENVSGLLEGENTIRVGAVKDLQTASPVTRTIVYSPEGETPLDSVTGIEYDIVAVTNENSSPHIRVFSSEGELVSQFFAFSETYRGEFRVITADVNGDDQMEIVVWPYGEGYGPQMRIFTKEGTLLAQEMVLNEGYRGGINVVNNIDLDGDGKQDMVVVPQGNGGPNLRAYKYNSQTGTIDLLAWTMAYQEEYQGKIGVVTADVTGDGNINIITSPLEGGPNVRVFHYDSTTETLELDGWFMAYQEEFKDGVLVATDDVNGDGQKDIVTYPEEDGGANIRAYTYNSETKAFELINWIQPFSDEYRGSMKVKLTDLDKDDQAEIIVAPATNGGPNLRVYSYNATTEDFELKDWEMIFADDFRGGVGLAVSNLDGDAYREVVVYPLTNGGPNLRVYEYDAEGQLTLMDWTYVYAEEFRGEISVKVGDLDGDGVSSLVVTPLTDGGPNLRILNVEDGELTVSNWFMAYDEAFRGGVLTKFIN